jgi:hypothetical protein
MHVLFFWSMLFLQAAALETLSAPMASGFQRRHVAYLRRHVATVHEQLVSSDSVVRALCARLRMAVDARECLILKQERLIHAYVESVGSAYQREDVNNESPLSPKGDKVVPGTLEFSVQTTCDEAVPSIYDHLVVGVSESSEEHVHNSVSKETFCYSGILDE